MATDQLKGSKLNVLIIDDSEEDAELVRLELERGGYQVSWKRVQTAEEVQRATAADGYDCIICDHKMPGFTSIEALKIVKSHGIDVPFLIVSGVIGEEAAVEAMKSGAHDYIMKNNLLRLVPAIEREIREAGVRAENRERYERLMESERRFRSLAEAAPIMIWMCDKNKKCTYFNRRWTEFLGEAPQGGTCAFQWGELVHPDDRERALQKFDEAFQERKEFSVEYRIRRKDGEWRTMLDTAAPREDGNGKFEGFIGSCQDLTDQARARDAAEQANRAKSHFLANMSHEIRTPLGAILGFADLLRDEELDAEERNYYLGIIIRNGNELLRIIGDILDLSKIEAGKLAVEISNFRLEDFVNEVVSLLEIKAREKGLALRTRVASDVPTWLESDRTRLRQILINIVGNSVKFTSSGEVAVSIDRVPSEGGRPALIRFTIDDTGPGIAEESRPKLFQAFSQGDSSTTREFGGTGLGLALSRHMARALKGDVELGYTPNGRGARFIVTVAEKFGTDSRATGPLRGRHEKTNAQPKAPRLLDGVRVLVIEDLKDNQILIRNWLERNGAQVETAENAFDGMDRAIHGQHQIVLMDIHMPDLDGYEAMQRLRGQGFVKPIVAITAHAMKDDRDRFLKAGFSRYLTKPLNMGDLVKTVKDLSH